MIKGFVCGAFDLLHAGHIHLLRQCKKECDFLIVGLQVDPSNDRSNKNKPIETVLEREIKLMACRFVDRIIVYEKEEDLHIILRYLGIDIRFLGSDYKYGMKTITGESEIPIKYIESLPIHSKDIRKRIRK